MTTRAAASQTGFTLIELMLVVSIIGILAAVALPAYQDYTRRSRVSESFVLAHEAQRAVAEYYDRWGRLPADNLAAGMAPPGDYRGRAVTAITVDNGMVIVDLDPGLLGRDGVTPHLYLRPGVQSRRPTAALIWDCRASGVAPAGFDIVGTVGARALESRLLPAACR